MKSPEGSTDCGAVSTHGPARPVEPCERAQARLFAELLGSEIDSMRAAVAVAEAERPRRKQSRAAGDREQRIASMNGRIDEATRILDALVLRYGVDQ
jgi:uncharacterized protein YceH (UPF0502 family)